MTPSEIGRKSEVEEDAEAGVPTCKKMHEYLRPWKLVTLSIGLGLLIVGSFYYQAPDWDIPISLIMAGLTYLTASWSVGVIRDRRWKMLPLAVFYYWLSVDGCYWLYWSLTNPDALYMRVANFYASTCLYWLCGMIWLYKGSVQDLLASVRNELKRQRG